MRQTAYQIEKLSQFLVNQHAKQDLLREFADRKKIIEELARD